MTTVHPRQVHVERVMGTVVSIDIRDPKPAAQAVERAVRWLHRVDATFSTYREDSAICRIDRRVLAAEDVDDDVAWVLRRCDELHVETGGFFSVRARGRLDPSALVKGWAVQRAADRLVADGFHNFCLTAGGDVVTRGAPSDGRRWQIGIQHPRDPTAIAMVLEASDLAVATSGAYERGQHITNPRTGRPPEGVLSVTVCGPDLGTADAYSTAAFAMGIDGPVWTLGLDGYQAMTIMAGVDEDIVVSTPGFPTALTGTKR
jgi:thiamine biosynthesis lipoprotein